VIDYFTNPAKYLDFDTLDYNYALDDGRAMYNVQGKSFEQATGIKKLGSGAYSDVYEIDENRVLKIVKRSDKAYEKFADLCREHKNNPHLPKILYRGVWGGKTVYILERLSDSCENDGETEYGGSQLKDNLRDAIRSGGRNSKNPFFSYATPHIAQLAEIVSQGGTDLHDGNIMFRGNVIVVTDPWG
jgi:hypothetical protein